MTCKNQNEVHSTRKQGSNTLLWSLLLEVCLGFHLYSEHKCGILRQVARPHFLFIYIAQVWAKDDFINLHANKKVTLKKLQEWPLCTFNMRSLFIVPQKTCKNCKYWDSGCPRALRNTNAVHWLDAASHNQNAYLTTLQCLKKKEKEKYNK